MTAARRLLAAILLGFGAAALVNIGWELKLPDQAEAVLSREDGTLRTLVATESVPARERYWITASLREVASGGVLVVPADGLVDTYHHLNFTEMEIRVEEYDPHLTAAEAARVREFPNTQGVASLHPTLQPPQTPAPFVVAWFDDVGPPPTMRVWFAGEDFYLVDDRIMEEVRP